METRWEITWLRYTHGNSSFIRANLWVYGVISSTDFRGILNSVLRIPRLNREDAEIRWECQSQPYGFNRPPVYYFVRTWELPH